MRRAQIRLVDNIEPIRDFKIKKFRQQQNYKKKYKHNLWIDFITNNNNNNIVNPFWGNYLFINKDSSLLNNISFEKLF